MLTQPITQWCGTHRLRRNRGGRTQRGHSTWPGCYQPDQTSSGAKTWQSRRLWSRQSRLVWHLSKNKDSVRTCGGVSNEGWRMMVSGHTGATQIKYSTTITTCEYPLYYYYPTSQRTVAKSWDSSLSLRRVSEWISDFSVSSIVR